MQWGLDTRQRLTHHVLSLLCLEFAHHGCLRITQKLSLHLQGWFEYFVQGFWVFALRRVLG